MANSTTLEDLVEYVLNPTPLALVIAILTALIIPIFLHTVVFKAKGLTTLPSILLVGPSGSGKTSLLTLFERGTNTETHTSQAPIAVEVSLPAGNSTPADKYRSENDPSNAIHKKFLLVDTPGHGKLRHHALEHIANPQNLRGVIFLVDAATLTTGDEGLRETADYLHDILLVLQKRSEKQGAKKLTDIPVLVAANKMDLFTALPAPLVKSALESEITKIRTSRSKGLLGVDDGDEEKDDWLGEMGSKEFRFSQLDEFDIGVEVLGGNVLGDAPTVGKWWAWIADRL